MRSVQFLLQNNMVITGQLLLSLFCGDKVSVKKIIDIAIIGGGSAGLMCGYIAGLKSKKALDVVIFERNSKTGRKLLATGNGKCNLSNQYVSAASYYSQSRSSLEPIAERLSFDYTSKLFSEIGLLIKTDNCGRAYPQSGNASSVLDLLRKACHKYGVKEMIDEKIISVQKARGYFVIKSDKAKYEAKCVILCCGGCASPVFGSDGNGFKLAQSLGHTLYRAYPSLAPVFVNEDLRAIKGVRCDCKISLLSKNKVIATEKGELQINDNNISGICVFNLSRYINSAFSSGSKPPEIIIDLLPDIELSTLKTFVIKNTFANPESTLEEVLTGVINKKLGGYIVKSALGLSPSTKCRSIGKKEITKICEQIKTFRVFAKSKSDFSKAQVSAGGVKLDEIEINTMESKIINGLYFAGEIVDVDAPCGGYNLQWAWTSAAISAESAVSRCFDDKN